MSKLNYFYCPICKCRHGRDKKLFIDRYDDESPRNMVGTWDVYKDVRPAYEFKDTKIEFDDYRVEKVFKKHYFYCEHGHIVRYERCYFKNQKNGEYIIFEDNKRNLEDYAKLPFECVCIDCYESGNENCSIHMSDLPVEFVEGCSINPNGYDWMQTLLGCPEFEDDDGVTHHHDSNVVNSRFICSNHHKFMLTWNWPCEVCYYQEGMDRAGFYF